MSKTIIIKKVNEKYKVPKLVKYRRNVNYLFEYNEKLYNKEIETTDKELKQISLLIEALNIKDKKKRLEFVYDKACDLLDNDFYGCNLCEFKNGKCMHDRKINSLGGGCCCNHDKSRACKHLTNIGCSTKCLACKFHICAMLKKQGYKFKVNDIYLIKYLYTWKQKIIIYNDFFMSKEEVLNDVYKNSLIRWLFTKDREFIKRK